ncbi:M28 family metallopeptidase [Halorarius halobius]|uniref:M28 family metallopeptidase n=1 Tax=Halorarius halobius TaxID=2962671 RepID=UPI0020CBF6A7|nr:M28 family metallopeptidase [Halorarius halobius]
MTPFPDTAIGSAYRSTAGWDLLDTLVDLDRMAGHDGEAEAARVLAEALREVGVDGTQIQPFEIDGWWRGESAIEADGRRFDGSHEVVALPNSPSGDVSATLADLGHGTPGAFEEHDVGDAVVLATRGAPEDSPWVQRWEKYGRAVDDGSVGFVLAGDADGCLPPTGHIGAPNRSPAAIPSVGISKEVASWLRRRDLESVSVSVSAESRTAESRNVEAFLGPETEREVLVTAHLDAHDVGDGAEDNGLGCATLVEIASLLAPLEEQLDIGVRFVGFGAEEIGIRGSEQWAATHDLDRVKAVMNVDTAGTGRTLKLKTMGFEGIETAVDTAADALEVPVAFEREVIPDSDHWPFVSRGIPAATANSVRETRGRGWGHTHGDTLDKLDRRDLREMAIVLGAGVLELANDDTTVRQVDPADVRDAVPEHTRRGLEASGRWPF